MIYGVFSGLKFCKAYKSYMEANEAASRMRSNEYESKSEPITVQEISKDDYKCFSFGKDWLD